VITGAPSCGKTTIINLLAEQGYKTVPECGRLFMEGEVTRGRSMEEIHENPAALNRSIEAMKLKVESELNPDDLVFLDDAVPGSLAWFRVFGLNPNDILPDCFRHRYASVFILDPLPLELDGYRFKNDALIGFLDEWIAHDFNTLGYQVVRIPVLTPDERLAFVLKRLSDQGLL
jgi:predicted ATPase